MRTMSRRPGQGLLAAGQHAFKELLLLRSGLNFLHMPSCQRIRRGRARVVQRENSDPSAPGPGAPRWRGCCGPSASVPGGFGGLDGGVLFVWGFWFFGGFGGVLSDLRESFLRVSPVFRLILVPLLAPRCWAPHLNHLHLPAGFAVGQTPKSPLPAGSSPPCPAQSPESGIWDSLWTRSGDPPGPGTFCPWK